MKLTIWKHAVAVLSLIAGLVTIPANATNELVSSSESHSIEKFNVNGKWTNTFASTGPFIAIGIAASPITNDVFVATNSGSTQNIILRYTSTGADFGVGGAYWRTFDVYSIFKQNPVQALVFDKSGDLYVASQYGTSGYTVEIVRFPAAQLTSKNPVPFPITLKTTLGRGNQMAFDAFNNLCISSFIAPNTVHCYSTLTGGLVFDYTSEIQAAGIQPVGLSFDSANKLTVNSVFTGEVWTEEEARKGPMREVASGMVADVGYLATDSAGMLYMPSFHDPEGRFEGVTPYSCTYYSCMDQDFNSDVVYKIDPATGAVSKFITTHLWGPYQMIFVP